MELFSISQLSRFSGIKQHTIRVWELRYRALQPSRSQGNTRYYDSIQLRRLLNIVSLIDRQHKASYLCGLPDQKLFEMIDDRMRGGIDPSDRSEYYISQLIAAGITYDEQHFDKTFSAGLDRYTFAGTYNKVIYPMMVRMGMMWSADNLSPANEHFVTNLLKQKIFAAIDALPPFEDGGDKWLLFLQEGEYHELGLLFAAYLIRAAGRRVVYLGSDVPVPSLLAALKTTRPDYLLLFQVRRDEPETIGRFLENTANAFAGKGIFIAGDEQIMASVPLNKKTKWMRTADDLRIQLEN